MPVIYKIDVVAALKNAGYSTYKIRQEKLIPESTLTKLREGKLVSLETIESVCKMLHCKPADILDYIDDE